MGGPSSIAFLDGLSIDLLICTLGLKRMVTLSTPYIEGFVGQGVYQSGDATLYTALEVYQGSSLPGFSVLQFRSQIIEGHGVAFAHSLSSWIHDCSFSQLIILTGLDKRYRNDLQLNSSPIRYLASSNVDEALVKVVNGFQIAVMEPVIDSHQLYPVTIPPGAGIYR